ncbi:MAG: hypothetical protein JJT75_08755 [Opitutales bacterium]|nr:hypothetical protein [Opitutales bacterium]MCH8541704.1 hypothetical protein [Opitutales bacterium]
MRRPYHNVPAATRTIRSGLVALAFFLILPSALHAAITVNWGNTLGDVLVTSENDSILPGGDFTFQLGAFTDGASPYSTSYVDWSSNWAIFDQATLSEPFGNGEFTFNSTANLQADGTSDSDFATDNHDFSGAEIYLWVFNENGQIESTTEWFLARVEIWTLPNVTADGGCDDCPTDPLEFAFSELVLGDIIPVFGGIEEQTGDGYFIDRNTAAQLQTFTVIPEPRFWSLLAGFLALGLVYRRRRKSLRGSVVAS